jgi:hypothetical protein
MYDYAGAVHMHSAYSFDGTTPVGDIITAARRSNLDFIVLTDHFRLDAITDGWDGWHDGVLVIVGEEISPRYNHYLALGITQPVIAWQKKSLPQSYIDAVNAQGGFGFIAHPDHTGAPQFGVKSYAWKDWSVQGYRGISIWDLMTDWQECLTSPLAALRAYLFPAAVLRGPKPETLARWDALNQTRRIAGYGEIDNHNSRKRVWGRTFRIFPFTTAFTTIRTHVLLPAALSADPVAAQAQVLAALAAGTSYVAQERWVPATGFQFRAYSADRTAVQGETLDTDGNPAVLEITVPAAGRIRLFKNGAMIDERSGEYLQCDAQGAGVYRAEVAQRRYGSYKPWIYSNPIWIGEHKR